MGWFGYVLIFLVFALIVCMRRFFATRTMFVDLLLSVKPAVLYLMRKEYNKDTANKSKEEQSDLMATRIKGYVAINLFCLGNMYLGGAISALHHMKDNNDLSPSWERFMSHAILLSFCGLAAGSFPSDCPLPMFWAGLGAWMSSLLLLCSFHLQMSPYYANPKESQDALVLNAFLFSFFWSLSAQDPYPLHLLGKIVTAMVCSPLLILRHIFSYISSKLLEYHFYLTSILPTRHHRSS